MKLPYEQIQNTVKLLDEGMTIPFIARYRKEKTGELDETQIRGIDERLKHYRSLEQKKAEILRLITEQGKMTVELQAKIQAATKLTELDDLYRPYRPKRKTRASVARERGLEPLASYLLTFPRESSPEMEAKPYLSEAIPSIQEALQGAKDIIAEQITDDSEVRAWVRAYTFDRGFLVVKAREEEKQSVYSMYYDYREPLKRIVPHRILAINRGVREEYLKVAIEVEVDPLMNWLFRREVKEESTTASLVKEAIMDGYKRLLEPAVERDLRNHLTEKAEAQAITIFSRNLRSLLLQSPVKGKICLAIDPAYRTGCKFAVVNATGKLLETGVIYPTPPQKKIAEAEKELERLVKQYQIQSIILGNGTASRETEQFIVDFLQKYNYSDLAYTIVNEAGASVYSASELAAKEFPHLDVSHRSAVSLARRIQDPLAELVKIDPKSVGVGQYQHDIAPKKLDASLSAVVESVVNYVGVNLNTASPSLLKYVAGINATVAENIVQYRETTGPFHSRRELKKVAKLGPKAFEQCAGFLRIPEGNNPLDNTAVHPESYALTERLLESLDATPADIGSSKLNEKLKAIELESTAEKLGAGLPTLRDIIESLMRPGRDPREDLPLPVFRKDVLSMEDLRVGMEFQGVVRNVVDFGVFVDIGVKQDGLVHISEISEKRIQHPLDVVAVGHIIKVRVLSVDPEKNRIALTMKVD